MFGTKPTFDYVDILSSLEYRIEPKTNTTLVLSVLEREGGCLYLTRAYVIEFGTLVLVLSSSLIRGLGNLLQFIKYRVLAI